MLGAADRGGRRGSRRPARDAARGRLPGDHRRLVTTCCSRWSARTTTTFWRSSTAASGPSRAWFHRDLRLSSSWRNRSTPGEPDDHHTAVRLRAGRRPPRRKGARAPLDALHPHGRLRARARRARSSSAARAATSGTSTATATSTGSRRSSACNAGHGRTELARGRRPPGQELDFFTIWSYAHPRAIELAARIAALAPGRPQPRLLHLRRLRGGRVGAEARPRSTTSSRASRSKHKVIAREIAYHGTTSGRSQRTGHPGAARRRSSRSPPAAATSRTRTSTAGRGRRRGHRSGPPTGSRSASSSRAPRRSPR